MLSSALNINAKSLLWYGFAREKKIFSNNTIAPICRTFPRLKSASASRHRRCPTGSSLGIVFRNTLHVDCARSRSIMSRIRQNFHEEVEQAINRQINMELYASYVYLSMAYYMDRDDVALPGLFEYFKKASSEEREHAMKFMEYQNKRGGRIELSSVSAPEKSEWGSPKEAMEAALQLEKDVNQSLLEIHGLAGQKVDPHLCDFLETEFLEEQVKSIKELGDHLTNLDLVGDGLGVYMFDKHFDKK